jgi:penicillin-binding protein 1A
VRRSIWISLVSLLGVVLLGVLSASPLAQARAHREAEKRGLRLEMGDFRLGFFEAELKDVRLRLAGVEQITVKVERVVVDFSLGAPRLRRLVAENGKVEIKGSLGEVRSAVAKWREARPKSESEAKAAATTRRTEMLRNFEVEWIGAFGNDDKQIISGLNLERDREGLRIGADLLEISRAGVSAQVAGALLKAGSASFDLSHAEELGAAEMRITYQTTHSVDDESEAHAPSPQEKDPGLSDSLEKDSERVVELRRVLGFLREKVAPLLPPKTEVKKIWFTYRRDAEKLHVGPSLLGVEKQKHGLVVTVTPRESTKGTPLSLALTLLPSENPVAMKLALEGGPVSLSTLGVEEGAFGLSGVAETDLSGSFSAELDKSVTTIQGGGEVSIDGLAIDSPKLSESLVTFPKLALTGKGKLNVDGTLLHLEEAQLRLGDAGFIGAFEIQGGESFVALKASASAPLVSCQALLDSAPRGLLASAEQMKFDGTFSLDLNVEADTRKLGEMKVRWDFKNGCRVTAVPAELDPEQFRRLFRREVLGAGGFPVELEFGPLSSDWVPWEEVSPYVEKALLVTEDGRFYRHQGFDDRAIESAIRANVESGHFVRGASTISMQLAKNLYLSRKKTLARKFQEAALTSLLEQNFEKRELLELYVNVVEFGPGIYGIRQAAEYYFSTTPGSLTPAQSFFIASVLPAPTRRYFEEDGRLNAGRADLVRRLLKISRSRDALTDSELDEALKEELIFGKAATLPEGALPSEAEKTERGEEDIPHMNSDERIFPDRANAP